MMPVDGVGRRAAARGWWSRDGRDERDRRRRRRPTARRSTRRAQADVVAERRAVLIGRHLQRDVTLAWSTSITTRLDHRDDRRRRAADTSRRAASGWPTRGVDEVHLADVALILLEGRDLLRVGRPLRGSGDRCASSRRCRSRSRSPSRRPWSAAFRGRSATSRTQRFQSRTNASRLTVGRQRRRCADAAAPRAVVVPLPWHWQAGRSHADRRAPVAASIERSRSPSRSSSGTKRSDGSPGSTWGARRRAARAAPCCRS